MDRPAASRKQSCSAGRLHTHRGAERFAVDMVLEAAIHAERVKHHDQLLVIHEVDLLDWEHVWMLKQAEQVVQGLFHRLQHDWR